MVTGDKVVVWANRSYMKDSEHLELLREFTEIELSKDESIQILPGTEGCEVALGVYQVRHWSRQFEWPWAIMAGDLAPEHVILDAGGGDALFQYAAAKRCKEVVNLDFDKEKFDRMTLTRIAKKHPNIQCHDGDLKTIDFPKDSFDRVFCISTLEHIQGPEMVVNELVRVLKKGGILVMTLDVSSYARWNHTLDLKKTSELLGILDLEFPEFPQDLLSYWFKEIDPKPEEPKNVLLQVLCIRWRKP